MNERACNYTIQALRNHINFRCLELPAFHIVATIHTTLVLSHPEWGTEWDIDFHKGISTRKKILEEQSMSKNLTMSCHLPWPGLGYIIKKGKGYSWTQMPISTPYI